MKCISFFAFVSILLSTSMVALAQDSHRDLADRMSDMFGKRQEREAVDSIPGKVLAEQPERALDLLVPYEQHDSARIRWVAYAHYWSLGVSSPDPGIRQQVTSRLVDACNDPDSLVWQYASRRLLSFEEADFTDDSKAVLHRLLRDDRLRRKDIIWVVGVADMREELPTLKSFLVDESKHMTSSRSGKWYGGPSWPARLARARMGVQEDVQRAIELVELEEDPVTRVTRLLKHLGYTHQPAAFEYIATYLDSEERLPRVKDTVPGTLCAQYAMDVLAQNLPGFPAKRDNIGAHTQAEIIRAREWMKSRGSRQ